MTNVMQAAAKAPPRNKNPKRDLGSPPEPKDVKFRRLANQRMNKAIKSLRGICNLGNRSAYTYTDDQAARIVGTLTNCVEAIADAFARNKTQLDGFQL